MSVGRRGEMNGIWKLLNMVLLVFLFVLIIYGLTTKGLNPLIKKVGVEFDNVRALFGFGEGLHSGCYVSRVSELGGGQDFLNKMGASDVLLSICKDGSCEINGSGVGAYKLKDGYFKKLFGEVWRKDDAFLLGNLNVAKFNWDAYHAGVGLLNKVGESSGFSTSKNFLTNPKDTQKFILYGDGRGFGGDVVAVWQNNRWEIRRGPKIGNRGVEYFDSRMNVWVAKDGRKVVYQGSDDKVALKMFYGIVTSGLNDNVYWKVLDSDKMYGSVSNRGEEIGSFLIAGRVSLKNIKLDQPSLFSFFRFGSGDNSKLDSDKKFDLLFLKFESEKEKLLDELNPDIAKVRALGIDGKSVSVGGVSFVANVESLQSGGFVVVFSSGSKSFALKYSPHGKGESGFVVSGRPALDASPFVLVRWANGWVPMGNEEYYKLYEKDFKEAYRGRLISDFLRDKCK